MEGSNPYSGSGGSGSYPGSEGSSGYDSSGYDSSYESSMSQPVEGSEYYSGSSDYSGSGRAARSQSPRSFPRMSA